jgi:hypothetical protein
MKTKDKEEPTDEVCSDADRHGRGDRSEEQTRLPCNEIDRGWSRNRCEAAERDNGEELWANGEQRTKWLTRCVMVDRQIVNEGERRSWLERHGRRRTVKRPK